MRRPAALATVFVLLTAGALTQAPDRDPPPYRNPRLSTDARVTDLLSRMTLEEKFWQLYMTPGDLDDLERVSPEAPARMGSPAEASAKAGLFGLQISTVPRQHDGETATVPPEAAARLHAERINAIQRFFVEKTRLGIPIIPFDEALHGVVQPGSTTFPQAIGLAATWDADLVSRTAAAIARETRSRGIRQVLSPVVNIADDVRWGRVEETYGEDPFLASVMGEAFIEAFERSGIVATPKHFVANVGEGGRDSYPIDHSDRLLLERYLPPFEAAVRRAGARSIMTAYNSVGGLPATQNPRLLNGLLKREWGFRGFVISDASATGGATVLHMTEPDTPTAAKHAWEAGLDVVFQSAYRQYRPYWDAVRRGLVSEAVIDAAVERVLRAKLELGLFEQPYVDVEEAARWNGHAEHRALARESARASIVLLKNDRGLLPLRQPPRRLAVIGVDAIEARLGGYSGPGIAPVSILEGLRRRFGTHVEARHAPGPGRVTREFAVIPPEALSSPDADRFVPGLRGEYFDNNRLEGSPRIVRTDPRVDFRWTLNSPGRGIPFDWYSVRWTGRLTARPAGVRRLAVEGNDGYRLYLNGDLIIDNWKKQSYGIRAAAVDLRPGAVADIRLEYFESTGNARLKLLWDVEDDSAARIDAAAELARWADVTVIVAGLEEGEFRDRAFLGLPGRQEDLILRLAGTGKPLIVVLIGGSAVTMTRWIEKVNAVIEAWYPGEEGGHAVADVLAGDYNPAGRLPITFPMTEGQLPLHYNHKPTGRGDDYLDATGYPLFPFGFGLSYTTFEYSNLRIEPALIGASETASITFTVANGGTVAGDEVAQLYVRDVLASVARPVMDLRGFERIHLQPGESREVTLRLGPEHLRMLDRDLRWVVEPGAFRVMVGSSSRDIRLRGELVVR